MALKFMGRAGYAETVERQIGLTEYFAGRLDELSEFERVGKIETAVCCFKFLPSAAREAAGAVQDQLQQKFQQSIERGGEAWLTTTVLHGRRALRVNVNSFLTEQRHIDDLVELLKRTSRELTV
jgi:aromatic-L-amino-acid decarboxylase